MSLLRARDALLYLSLMAAHLGDGQIVDGQTLTAAIDADLPGLLRSYTAEEEIDGAIDADTLLIRWRKKGWVHRSADPRDPRVERYQLTSGASAAIRQIQNLQRQSSIATESALAMVMSQLREIATDSNPDPAARRHALEIRIEELSRQRDAIERGEVPMANHADLIDKVTTLVQLTDRIPGDVAAYGEQMHTNTAVLLRQSLAGDAEFADALQRMFDGHDVIAESPEGQAFRAFATAIATPSQRSQLESDITEIVDRVDGLPDHLSESLQDFIPSVWRRIQDVEDVRGAAFRRISSFVRGGDLTHYRSMRTRIGEAQASAALAFHATHGGRDIGFVVPMSGLDAHSVGRLRLDQGTGRVPDLISDTTNEFDIDPSAIAGHESIDWAALRNAVHAAMERHSGYATLPEALEQLPDARTGDVIGLWSLATRYGDVDDDGRSTVWAQTARGPRKIVLPYAVFAELIPGPPLPSRQVRTLGAQVRLFGGGQDG
jgi:DNA-binding MarR family transcriptional regulator